MFPNVSLCFLISLSSDLCRLMFPDAAFKFTCKSPCRNERARYLSSKVFLCRKKSLIVDTASNAASLNVELQSFWAKVLYQLKWILSQPQIGNLFEHIADINCTVKIQKVSPAIISRKAPKTIAGDAIDLSKTVNLIACL